MSSLPTSWSLNWKIWASTQNTDVSPTFTHSNGTLWSHCMLSYFPCNQNTQVGLQSPQEGWMLLLGSVGRNPCPRSHIDVILCDSQISQICTINVLSWHSMVAVMANKNSLEKWCGAVRFSCDYRWHDPKFDQIRVMVRGVTSVAGFCQHIIDYKYVCPSVVCLWLAIEPRECLLSMIVLYDTEHGVWAVIGLSDATTKN